MYTPKSPTLGRSSEDHRPATKGLETRRGLVLQASIPRLRIIAPQRRGWRLSLAGGAGGIAPPLRIIAPQRRGWRHAALFLPVALVTAEDHRPATKGLETVMSCIAISPYT